jgi:hypothetical protein
MRFSYAVMKRRPLAYGVVATGSSVGGVIFPLIVKKLLVKVGFVLFASLSPLLSRRRADRTYLHVQPTRMGHLV